MTGGYNMADEKDCVSRSEFNDERNRINERLSEHDKAISVLDSMYHGLIDLPKTIANLDKTIGIMGANIENLNEQFKNLVDEKERQNHKLSEIDGKSKVDFLQWAKNNWTSIVMFIVMLILLVGEFIPLK